MKMMIQADDYGITKAVADGIIACAKAGMMTQTGLFSNMACAQYAVNRWKEEAPFVLLGQDLNLCAGYPVTDPKLIPSLVQPNGKFKTSKMHKELDKTDKHHVPYEEAYLEYDNQVKRFIELAGKKPGYIGGHAWGSDETNRAMSDICVKYGIFDVTKEAMISLEKDLEMIWARPIDRGNGVWEFNANTQIENDPLKMFREGKLDARLNEALANEEVFMLHTHAGFVDRDLTEESSYTMIRAMEAGFLCSEELRNWVKENNIELVTYADVYENASYGKE